jgi:hypothetical protein
MNIAYLAPVLLLQRKLTFNFVLPDKTPEHALMQNFPVEAALCVADISVQLPLTIE